MDASLANIEYEASLVDKTLEKTFVNAAKALHAERVAPSLTVPTNTGNMYTASLYAALSSLLYYVGSDALQNKRIGLFSYGSGLASSLFSCKVVGDIKHITDILDLDKKLNSRSTETPEDYEKAILLREHAHLQKDFSPKGSIDHLQKGTYYLSNVDNRYRRAYEVK